MMKRRAFIGGLALAAAANAGPVGLRLPKPASGGGSSFVPGDIAGMQLWLDASQIVGLNDGDPVTDWPDSSGNGYDYAQATGSKQPTYKTNIRVGGTLPVVRLDGVDDSMTGAHVITVKTEVVVFDITGTPPQFATVAGLRVVGNINTIYRDTSNTRLGTYQGGAGFGPALSGVGTGFLVVINRFDATTNKLRIDGVDASPVAGVWNTSWISGEIGYLFGVGLQYFSGDVAHRICYNTMISDADCANMENYFATH